MAIVYDKLLALLKEKGYTTYRIRQEGIMGNATLQVLRHPENGKGLDYRSIDKLCRVLQCQPADIMEYIPDEELESYLAAIEKKKEGH